MGFWEVNQQIILIQSYCVQFIFIFLFI